MQQNLSLPIPALKPNPSANNHGFGPSSYGIAEQQHSNHIMRLSSVDLNHDPSFGVGNHNHSNLINLTRHEQLLPNPSMPVNPLNLANLQFRSSLGSGGEGFLPDLPPEFFISTRLGQNYQEINSQFGGSHELPVNSLTFDMSRGLNRNLKHPQQQQLDAKMFNSNNISRANSGLINKSAKFIGNNDNLMDLKNGRPRGSVPFNPNQFIIDGSLPTPLDHLSLLNQATMDNIDHSLSHTGPQSLTPSGQQDINTSYYYNPRKPLSSHNVPKPSVDFNADHMKPGAYLPRLRQHYPSQQTTSFLPPTSIYGSAPGMDLKHLSALYNPVMSQQMVVDPISQFSHPSTHQHQQQQERHKDQKSKMFTTNNPADYYRQSSSKRAYR
jgi:hypothetical protein